MGRRARLGARMVGEAGRRRVGLGARMGVEGVPLQPQGPPALPPRGRAVNKRRDVRGAAGLRLNPEL